MKTNHEAAINIELNHKYSALVRKARCNQQVKVKMVITPAAVHKISLSLFLFDSALILSLNLRLIDKNKTLTFQIRNSKPNNLREQRQKRQR